MLLRFLGYVVGMIIVTAVTLCFWLFNFKQPLEESKKEIDNNYKRLRAKLNKGKRFDKEIKKYRSEISEKKRAIVSLLKEKTKNRDVGQFLNDVELDATNSDIKLKSIRIHPKTQRQRYMEIPMEFSVDGTYFGLYDFFSRVENRQMLNLTNSSLSLGGGGSGRGVEVKNLSDKIDKTKKLNDLHEKPIKMKKYEKDTRFPVLRVQFDGRIIIIDRSHIARYEE